MRLAALAPGKVNLCLFVGGKRADGRHEVVTLFESVSLMDELSVSTLQGDGPDEVVCPGVEGPNLVSRALEGLRQRGWNSPPVKVEIAKRVPVAAGMGGGSGDAAAMLRLALRLAPIPKEAIRMLATELGADVPGQLEPGASIGTGAGDEVERVPPLAPHAFVIVPSARSLSAANVYGEADRLGVGRGSDGLAELRERVSTSLERDRRPPSELIVNDLEPAAISLCAEIGPALDAARNAGADQALVSGSGPTVFGLFWGADAPERATAAERALSRSHKGAMSAVPVDGDVGHPHVRAQSVADR